MRCHQINIESDWLDGQTVLYETMLDDAFQILIFENVNELRRYFQSDNNWMNYLKYEPNVERQIPGADQEFVKSLCISVKQRNSEFQIVKKGGIMGSLEVRPGRFNNSILQQMKAKQSMIVKRQYPTIKNIDIEEQASCSMQIPWQQKGTEQARIMLLFEKRAPIAIYLKDRHEAYKWQTYLIIENLIAKEAENLPHEFQSFILNYNCIKQMIWTNKMEIWIAHYSNFLNDERKKNARLQKKERDFIDNCEFQVIQKSLLRWKRKSTEQYQRELSVLQQQREEEMNRRREEEQQRKQNEEMRTQHLEIGKNHDLLDRILGRCKTQDQLAKDFLLGYCLIHIQYIYSWVQRAEFIYKMQDSAQALTVRNILIQESFTVARPIVELGFFGKTYIKRNQFTLDLSATKRINNKSFRLCIDGSDFYTLRMQALLLEKARTEHFSWSIQESPFERSSGTQRSEKHQVAQEGCTIKVNSFTDQDWVYLKVKDSLAIFEDSQSERLVFSLSDIYRYSEMGRNTWIPIRYTKKQKNTEISQNTIMVVEVDFMSLPSGFDSKNQIYDEDLQYIVSKDLPHLDPIYLNTFELPYLNKNTLKVLLKIMEENNPYMKNSVRLISFMIFVGSQENQSKIDIDQTNQEFQDIKKFVARKITQNNGLLFTRTSTIEWKRLTEKYQGGDAIQLIDYFHPIVSNRVEPYFRESLWFIMMNGAQNSYGLVTEILKRRFFIFPEQRTNLDAQTWAYVQFKAQNHSIRIPLFKDIESFLENEQQANRLPAETLQTQCRNVMQTFLFFVVVQGNALNVAFIPNLLLIIKKFVSLSNYHFIKQEERCMLIDLPSNEKYKGYSNYTKQIELEQFNEAFAFWLIVAFSQHVLSVYPLFKTGDLKKIMFEDCSYIMLYLQKTNPKMLELTKTHELQPENVFYDIIINLFATIFPSELLFTVWDLIIYKQFQFRTKDVKEKNLTIPCILISLLDRLETKVSFVYSPKEFYSAIQLEACLISNYHEFANQILEKQTTLIQVIQQVQSDAENKQVEENPLNRPGENIGDAMVPDEDY